MPVLGITTPIEFAHDEWDKLARAWRLMQPSERDRELRAHLDRLREEGKLSLYPDIPGWDDVLKTGRVPLHLTPDELKARRKAVTARIKQQVTPQEQLAIASVVNAIDDVQDLASFAGLVARLVIRAAPRVAARFIPVLGWIATASDVLNLLGTLTQASGLLVGLHTEGALGAVAASAGPVFTKALLKREIWTALRRGQFHKFHPNAMSRQLAKMFAEDYKLPPLHASRAAALVGKRVGIGAIIESGQAIETLTGYGLSLGALMGYINDFAWATYRDVVGAQPDGTTRLIRAIGQSAPQEFLIFQDEKIIEALDWSHNNGRGPAWGPWYKKYQFPLHKVHPWALVEDQSITKAPWCWVAKYIQAPTYPREPDSIVGYKLKLAGPNDFYTRFGRAQFSQFDLILEVRPTVDGL